MDCGFTIINFIRSSNFECVASSILAMLFVDGHRGCPYFDQRLLLLKVVGSSPLYFASAEQDIFLSLAKQSIAYHTSLCVICLYSLLIKLLSRLGMYAL